MRNPTRSTRTVGVLAGAAAFATAAAAVAVTVPAPAQASGPKAVYTVTVRSNKPVNPPNAVKFCVVQSADRTQELGCSPVMKNNETASFEFDTPPAGDFTLIAKDGDVDQGSIVGVNTEGTSDQGQTHCYSLTDLVGQNPALRGDGTVAPNCAP